MKETRYDLPVQTCSLPAGRLTAPQVARFLGFQEHDIPVLVTREMLKPLGKPKQNSVKYFASVEVVNRANDEKWLSKATQAIYDYWQEKNGRRKSAEEESKSFCQ
jgi:hypothetical protein